MKNDNTTNIEKITNKAHETLAVLRALAESLDNIYSITRPELTKENEKKIFLAYFEIRNGIDTLSSLNNLTIRQLNEIESDLAELATGMKG